MLLTLLSHNAAVLLRLTRGVELRKLLSCGPSIDRMTTDVRREMWWSDERPDEKLATALAITKRQGVTNARRSRHLWGRGTLQLQGACDCITELPQGLLVDDILALARVYTCTHRHSHASFECVYIDPVGLYVATRRIWNRTRVGDYWTSIEACTCIRCFLN